MKTTRPYVNSWAKIKSIGFLLRAVSHHTLIGAVCLVWLVTTPCADDFLRVPPSKNPDSAVRWVVGPLSTQPPDAAVTGGSNPPCWTRSDGAGLDCQWPVTDLQLELGCQADAMLDVRSFSEGWSKVDQHPPFQWDADPGRRMEWAAACSIFGGTGPCKTGCR